MEQRHGRGSEERNQGPRDKKGEGPFHLSEDKAFIIDTCSEGDWEGMGGGGEAGCVATNSHFNISSVSQVRETLALGSVVTG